MASRPTRQQNNLALQVLLTSRSASTAWWRTGGQDRDTIRAIGDFILASDKLRPSNKLHDRCTKASQPAPANKIASGPVRFCAWAESGLKGAAPKAGWSIQACGLTSLGVVSYAQAAPGRRSRYPAGVTNLTNLPEMEYSRVPAPTVPRPTSILREKKMGPIPRTRKEKRQNLRRCRQIQSHYASAVQGGAVHDFPIDFLFKRADRVSPGYDMPLTFLATTRQRRQTSRCMAIQLSRQCPLKTYHFTTMAPPDYRAYGESQCFSLQEKRDKMEYGKEQVTDNSWRSRPRSTGH